VQTIGSLVALALVAVVLLAGGIYVLITAPTGYTSRLHKAAAVECTPVPGVTCTGRTTCHTRVVCAVSGEFGQLSHEYREGTQPHAGDSVHVYTSSKGQQTLGPPWPPVMLGVVLLVLALVVALLWLMTYKLRRNKYFLMWQGARAILN